MTRVIAKAQPAWTCRDCGGRYGKARDGVSTWHVGTCGVCDRIAVVTEPRDYGYLSPGWTGERAARGKGA
jgi:hypothetical protein